jgi:hypothetical protein
LTPQDVDGKTPSCPRSPSKISIDTDLLRRIDEMLDEIANLIDAQTWPEE